MRDPDDKILLSFAAFCVLLALAFWGAVIYVAAHFIAKWW